MASDFDNATPEAVSHLIATYARDRNPAGWWARKVTLACHARFSDYAVGRRPFLSWDKCHTCDHSRRVRSQTRPNWHRDWTPLQQIRRRPRVTPSRGFFAGWGYCFGRRPVHVRARDPTALLE